VFCFGGWKAVDGMNAWTQALRTALVQQDCTYTVKEMADKPEALRLADSLAAGFSDCGPEAAAELRRLHAVNQELLKAMDKIAINTHDDTAERVARAAIARAEGEAK